jgi:ATP-dependent protease Clp ATPase subunit
VKPLKFKKQLILFGIITSAYFGLDKKIENKIKPRRKKKGKEKHSKNTQKTRKEK